jgi:RES domain-containing protein
LRLPSTSLVRQFDTHRLIPSKYASRPKNILTRIAEDDRHLADILELDRVTDDRGKAEHDLLPGIGVQELVFGVPNYAIVNATFCHAHPLGSRFNGPDRGAWYAAFELFTAQAEIVFHKTIQLAEIGCFEDAVTYDDYLADFSAEFHDLRNNQHFHHCLDPASYVASQELAEHLLRAGHLGVVYPSARKPGGTCLACFRPALVVNVRKASTYRLRWSGRPEPVIDEISGPVQSGEG